MNIFNFIKYNQEIDSILKEADENVREHFRRNFLVTKSTRWIKEKILLVLNKNTNRKNRYFHLVANFMDALTDNGNKEFIDSLGSPDGDGWRAIKRWLKTFEKKAYERLCLYKSPMNRERKQILSNYGVLLEGEELAKVSFRYNLCTRFQNPYEYYKDEDALLLIDGCIAHLQFHEDEIKLFEVQDASNDWPTNWQIKWLYDRTYNHLKWCHIKWWEESQSDDFFIESHLAQLHMQAQGLEGEGYDFLLDKGIAEISYYCKDSNSFKTITMPLLETDEVLGLLRNM